MNTQLMFSSDDMTWGTPQDLFDRLNREFKFTLDVCALPNTAKCEKYFTPEIDGLKQNWNGICWMNPPYGREIGRWLRKAYEESLKGNIIVCLIPARTDTKYWHEYCMKASEIRFIKGRLKFTGKTIKKEEYNDWNDLDKYDQPIKKTRDIIKDNTNNAPFPSAVVIFDSSRTGLLVKTYNSKE